MPLVNVNGVYVLPGIPRLFQKMLGAHRHRFKGPQSHDASCYTDMGEGDLAKPLGKIAQEYPGETLTFDASPRQRHGERHGLRATHFTAHMGRCCTALSLG